MSTNKPAASEITNETIAVWKEKHGKVTKYKTTDEKVLFFRTPSRAEVSAAQTANTESDGITSNQVLAKATCLGGDIEILNVDKYLMGIGKHLGKIVEKVEGEMEEL